MQYMLMIYTADNAGPQPGTPEFGGLMEEYGAFGAEVEKAGVFVAGDALQPASTATSVSMTTGEAVVTDGPFAETRETLGGYYLLDCKDLDEAMAYAAKIPSAKFGTIEVRPVMVFDH